MIIWLNGPFGGGKTTLAAGLCRALPGAMVADPEAVGDLLRSTLADHALRPRDYQDLPLWRQLTGALRCRPGPAHGRPRHRVDDRPQPPPTPGRSLPRSARPTASTTSEAVRAYRRRRAPDCHQAATAWMNADGHAIDTSSTLATEHTLQAALDYVHLTAPARPRPPEVPAA
ncbi:AAA family ATPase [Streptomyces sp. enrichment culture]|uniref:AAA family ATPase n=1 Tax=Streptomyces sp. enrichment culture TaxID=1795815 RepID=UPI003F546626